ncbi:MAG TPA: zinc ribbon domain-containing protein [Candidatus Paceibacterota bacterium]|nr:zinc ribbon domain-containing protein [Verrucomicrobiota bacterium]HRZ47239.1 zinc ribbon domain-containing protein [Candidatus Paceibacterota bacterium]HRZ92833.1 zinc ribbon domain-containing protein [Candidatus Paceibacterota bacterium]
MNAKDPSEAAVPHKEAPTIQSHKGVLCEKCDHLNPPGSEACEWCHRALWVTCGSCGEKTPIALPRCDSCGRRIDRHGQQPRGWRRIFCGGCKLTISQIVLIGVIAVILYVIIFALPNLL